MSDIEWLEQSVKPELGVSKRSSQLGEVKKLNALNRLDRKLDARTRILRAGLALFAQRGFEGVSTTDIAKAAAVTQPLIHYHFKTKEMLWRACIEDASQFFKHSLFKIDLTQEMDHLIKIGVFVRSLIQFNSKQPEFCRFLVRESMESGPRLDWLTKELIEPLFKSLAFHYEEGVNAGVFNQLPFNQFVIALIAACSQVFIIGPMCVPLLGIQIYRDQEIAHLVDLVMAWVNVVLIHPSAKGLTF